MKTLRKYANMAFLLISVTAIVPTYANSTINEQEKVKQEKITVEPKKTGIRYYYNRYGEIIGEVVIGVTSLAIAFYVLDRYMDINPRKIFA